LFEKKRNQQLALDHRMYYVGLGHAYIYI
jgi:hypothetical protein